MLTKVGGEDKDAEATADDDAAPEPAALVQLASSSPRVSADRATVSSSCSQTVWSEPSCSSSSLPSLAFKLRPTCCDDCRALLSAQRSERRALAASGTPSKIAMSLAALERTSTAGCSSSGKSSSAGTSVRAVARGAD